MDDILKRMLAVEQEADQIVRDSQTEAERIMEEGRREANKIAADAQLTLAKEVEALIQAKVDAALKGKKERLGEADRSMQSKLEDFRKKVDFHIDEACKALLFPAE